LVVFDWDGTIADSTQLIAECIQAAARDCGLVPPSDIKAKSIIGLGIRDSIQTLFPSLDAATLERFADAYRAHYVPRDGEVMLYAGVESLLGELQHEARFLAVATGKPRRGLTRAFQHCGLAHHFHYTRCADEGFPKPHPDMLERLMEFTGLGPEDTLMIGDTTHDLNMAKAARCDAVAVTYGAHPVDVLTAAQPRATVSSVAELRAWLLAHG
jgi:phosphoglycolate phosphatase